MQKGAGEAIGVDKDAVGGRDVNLVVVWAESSFSGLVLLFGLNWFGANWVDTSSGLIWFGFLFSLVWAQLVWFVSVET